MDRRESEKEGRNESEHRSIRASSTSAGLVCGGRKREEGREEEGRQQKEVPLGVTEGDFDLEIARKE